MLKNIFEQIAGKEVDFHYIPNGVDIDQSYEKISNEMIKKIPKNKFIVGYAGTIGVANAMEYFIEASIKLKNDNDIFFLIVGDGYLREKLSFETKDNNNINFLGRIKKSQVQDF